MVRALLTISGGAAATFSAVLFVLAGVAFFREAVPPLEVEAGWLALAALGLFLLALLVLGLGRLRLGARGE